MELVEGGVQPGTSCFGVYLEPPELGGAGQQGHRIVGDLCRVAVLVHHHRHGEGDEFAAV